LSTPFSTRASDLSDETFADWTALEAYCDATSGNLIRLATRILGGGDECDAAARSRHRLRHVRSHPRCRSAARHKVYFRRKDRSPGGFHRRRS
jgi:hypothetical protein